MPWAGRLALLLERKAPQRQRFINEAPHQPLRGRRVIPYGFSQNGTAYGLTALITCRDSKVETLRLRFELATFAKVQAQSIEPDPTPWEALAFWKGLVADLELKQTETGAAL